MKQIQYNGHLVSIVCNGGKNTRIRYDDNTTELVPNNVLYTIQGVKNQVKESIPDSASVDLWQVKLKALEMMGKYLDMNKWSFVFDEALTRAGQCSCRIGIWNRELISGTISLSKHFCRMNSWAEIIDTILHEIAHALTPGEGHGARWKAACLRVGAKPERCYDDLKVKMPQLRYRASCPCCQRDYSRSEDPRTRTGWYCRPCGRVKGTLVWADSKQIKSL